MPAVDWGITVLLPYMALVTLTPQNSVAGEVAVTGEKITGGMYCPIVYNLRPHMRLVLTMDGSSPP